MKNIILQKALDFGVKIIKLAESLESIRKFKLADQILRSGTSVGAM